MSDLTDTKGSAKEMTKKSMLIAALWIGCLSLAKGILYIFGKEFLEMVDIIISGVSMAAVFSPVFVSIWLDKIIELKKAGK
jgi:hypothetical protein